MDTKETKNKINGADDDDNHDRLHFNVSEKKIIELNGTISFGTI